MIDKMKINHKEFIKFFYLNGIDSKIFKDQIIIKEKNFSWVGSLKRKIL